jgi:hypothetical protein
MATHQMGGKGQTCVMLKARGIALRIAIAVVAAVAGFAADVSLAVAQSNSCARLIATLDTLDRNRDFRAYQSQSDQLRDLQRSLQQVESRYVRDGCNADARAGRPLNRDCRVLARQITEGREQLATLQRGVETGSAVAEQREAVLQEIARFGCSNNSRARVVEGEQPRGLFDQLFEQLSGNPLDQDIREGGTGDYFDGYAGYSTVRTICVRTCDGYYWPVSYSTIPDYVANDADQCQQQCPGSEVRLFYYNNPGEEAEQAVDLAGTPYMSLPNALKYRREFDATCTCKQQVDYGQINIAETGGMSRAMIDFNGVDFPLPLPDPRRSQPSQTPQQATEIIQAEAATYVSVPLPRRRPPAPGETPPPQPIAPAAVEGPARYAKFGDKTVRIVGPETPYAPVAEGES